MACCGRSAPIVPIIRQGLPTIWSWITHPTPLITVPHERLAEVLGRIKPEMVSV